MNASAKGDLVAIDRNDHIDQIVVQLENRIAGGGVRYNSPQNERNLRRAPFLGDEPVRCAPAFRQSRKWRLLEIPLAWTQQFPHTSVCVRYLGALVPMVRETGFR